jgi:hypothetical protein
VGLWSWFRETVTETTGGLAPVPIGLERNPEAVVELGAYNPPEVPLYVLRVGLASGFGGTEAGLPVYRRENEAAHPVLKEIYHCEVAGQTLEAANVYALREKVRRTLEVIAPAHTLPLCYFRAARLDYSLPVYQEGGKLVCPVLAGPKIKAPDLASMREPVIRHLRASGYLMPDEEAEIQVVRPSDLRLVPPAAVLRSLDQPETWLPTVEGSSPQGPVIGLLTHSAELRRSERRRAGVAPVDVPPSAPDVTALMRSIGQEMARRGGPANPWTLYATHVRPEIWARTEELTDPTPRRLECYLEGDDGQLELPIRHTTAGEVLTAIQERSITVFVAGDDQALGAVVGRYLQEAGFLRHIEELRVETERARPAERLDPDQIWTGETSPAEAPASQKLQIDDQEVTQT